MVGGPKTAVQFRLEDDELDALDRFVADQQEKAEQTGAKASQASIVRGIVRVVLIQRGYLVEGERATAKPRKKAR
jgi:hypothetical protein